MKQPKQAVWHKNVSELNEFPSSLDEDKYYIHIAAWIRFRVSVIHLHLAEKTGNFASPLGFPIIKLKTSLQLQMPAP